MKVFVTGGLGYIGSHTVVELLNEGHEVVVIDNLYNSSRDIIKKIEEITSKKFLFYEGDVCDEELLNQIFHENRIDAVIHFAGYKAVGESVENPIMYYENNLISTLHLCKKMIENNCFKIIFSSSATVYGDPSQLPITEEAKVGGTNLMPYIVRVATGKLEILSIFGNDYDTPDGTGVRDYIHVVDLAKGHIKALEKSPQLEGIHYYNLGTGVGYSVLDLVHAFEKVNGVNVPYKVVGRRAGDIASCYADSSLAYKELGWKAELGIEDMMRDSYNFILKQDE